jgi:hypothetical protein
MIVQNSKEMLQRKKDSISTKTSERKMHFITSHSQKASRSKHDRQIDSPVHNVNKNNQINQAIKWVGNH